MSHLSFVQFEIQIGVSLPGEYLFSSLVFARLARGLASHLLSRSWRSCSFCRRSLSWTGKGLKGTVTQDEIVEIYHIKER